MRKKLNREETSYLLIQPSELDKTCPPPIYDFFLEPVYIEVGDVIQEEILDEEGNVIQEEIIADKRELVKEPVRSWNELFLEIEKRNGGHYPAMTRYKDGEELTVVGLFDPRPWEEVEYIDGKMKKNFTSKNVPRYIEVLTEEEYNNYEFDKIIE